MAIGYLLRKIGMLDAPAIAKMSTVTFRVLLSTMTFQNIYACDIRQIWNGREVLINLALTLANFILALLIAYRVQPRKRDVRGSLVQGMFQNSYITFGVPIVSAAFGAAGAAMVGMMSALIVPLRNMIVVAYLSILCSERADAKKIVFSVLKNPFFLGGVLGFAVCLLGIRLPYILSETVSSLSRIATPLSLLLLGATLDFKSMAGYKKELFWGVMGKMVLIPIGLMPLAVLAGLRDAPLLSTCVMVAAPSATSAHIIAREMGADGDLAGQITVLTATVSILVFFVFIFALHQLHLI